MDFRSLGRGQRQGDRPPLAAKEPSELSPEGSILAVSEENGKGIALLNPFTGRERLALTGRAEARLEANGNKEARQALMDISKDPPDALLTREARASLARLCARHTEP